MTGVQTCALPIYVDNMGAIYLSASQMSSQRTKHIDIRHHGMKEYIEDGFIKVVFVQSENNVENEKMHRKPFLWAGRRPKRLEDTTSNYKKTYPDIIEV